MLSRLVTEFKGTPARPLEQGELREKFLMLTRHCDAAEMRELFDRLQNLENEPDLDWVGVHAH